MAQVRQRATRQQRGKKRGMNVTKTVTQLSSFPNPSPSVLHYSYTYKQKHRHIGKAENTVKSDNVPPKHFAHSVVSVPDSLDEPRASGYWKMFL